MRTLSIFLTLFTIQLSTIQLSNAEPLYWSAQKGALKLMIVGSIHVGDDSMYPLPAEITATLAQSNGLIVEADIRQNSSLIFPKHQTTTEQELNSHQRKELTGIASLLNLNIDELFRMPPWSSALAIQMRQLEYLGYKAQDGVDMWLLMQAARQGKPIYGLETTQFQINLLTSQPQGGKELLVSALEEFDHSENAMNCLIKSWKSGDINKLNEFAQLTEMSAELEQRFLFDRNHDWAKKLSDRQFLPKQRGEYVVVVGTLHLIGPDNLINLLQSKGFSIRQLSKSTAANCEFKY